MSARGLRCRRGWGWLILVLCTASLLAVMLMSLQVQAKDGEFDWRLDGSKTPTALLIGLPVRVSVRVTNLGETAWSHESGHRLAYHWRERTGEIVVLDGLRTPFAHAIQPGESIQVNARLEAPKAPGEYFLEWGIVQEGTRWYPAPQTERGDSNARYPVQIREGRLAWDLLDLEAPAKAVSGERFEVRVTVQNTGDVTWSSATGDVLAYHWWNDDGELLVHDGRRTPYPESVAPGEKAEVELVVTAPQGVEACQCRLEIEALREGVSWYGAPSKRPSSVSPGGRGVQMPRIEVSPQSIAWTLVDHDMPSRMHAGDPIDVTLTLHNPGSIDWGIGDSLSYRIFDGQGKRVAEGPRVPLGQDVGVGESLSVVARLQTPDAPGVYSVSWEPLREHEFWYGAPSIVRKNGALRRERLQESFRIEVTRPRLGWDLIEQSKFPMVWAGDEATIQVTVKNTGTETWRRSQGDHLAYHWLDAQGAVVQFDGQRSHLPRRRGPIAPGDEVTISARIRGPARGGEYRLQWEMVREHVRWFGAAVDLQGQRHALGPGKVSGTPVDVRSRAAWLQQGMVLLSLSFVLGMLIRRRRENRNVAEVRKYDPLILELGVLLWLWLAVWMMTITFAELSGLRLWSRGMAATASGAALFCLPTAMVQGRTRVVIATGTILAVGFMGVADLIYMHFFGSIVPVAALTASHHVGEVGASIASLIEPYYAWLTPIPLSAVCLAPFVAWQLRSRTPAPGRSSRALARFGPRLGAVGLCLVVASPFMVRLYGAMEGSLGKRVFSEQRNTSRFGYLNAHLFDAARSAREKHGRGSITAEEGHNLLDFHTERAQEVRRTVKREIESGGAPVPGQAGRANLLLIQVEAAQQWVIGARSKGREITPFLNRLHTRGFAYPNVVDQTAQGKTSDAEYATLNSQHPLGEGAVCFLRADNSFVSLAHVLKNEGYTTFSSHPYKRGFWNRAVLHPKYGFDTSMFRRELGPGQQVGWGLADGLFFERVLERLKTLQEPWFTFLITLSLHHPYDHFPPNLQDPDLDLGELQGTRVGNYLHAMNYFDRSLEALFDELERTGKASRTLVALYGDHDARFDLRDHPEILKLAGESEWSPSTDLRFERVPFFVVNPEAVARGLVGRITEVGGHIDIAPTLLHHLGVARPRAFLGRPLLGSEFLGAGAGVERTKNFSPGIAVYPNGSVLTEDRLFVARGRDIPRDGGCFDYPGGKSRPLADCEGLEPRAIEEISMSRAVVDFDFHRSLAAEVRPVQP